MSIDYWGGLDTEATDLAKTTRRHLLMIDVDKPEEAKERLNSLKWWLTDFIGDGGDE